jgi:hypothetical protein
VGAGAGRALAAVLAAGAVLAAAPAASAPPPRGTFVPGVSLGGVELGMTKAEVMRAWGRVHGVCRGCPRETWYFNYRAFEPQGTGVVFRRGSVVHAFTFWQPEGWRTSEGLALGAPSEEVGAGLVFRDERPCDGYEAILAPGPSAESVFYVYRDRLWGFGLIRPGADPCL